MGAVVEFLKYCIVAQWFIPKFVALAKDKDAMTLGDVFFNYFGKEGKVVAGFCSSMWAIGVVGSQISAIGFVVQHFLDISYVGGVSLAFGILVVYSALGGFRAVVATDIIQFILLVAVVPMICSIAVIKAGGWEGIRNAVPEDHWSFFPNKEAVLKFFPYYLAFIVPIGASPAFAQRLLMSENQDKIRKSLLISGFLIIPITLIVMLTSFSALKLYPETGAQLVYPAIIDNLLPVGIKGLAISGLLAIIMSTADSILNSGSIAIVHDLLRPFRKKTVNELNLVKWVTFAIGVFFLFISLRYKNIYDILRVTFLFSAAGIAGPITLVVLGYFPSKKAFVTASSISITCAILAFIFDKHIPFSVYVPCLLLSITLMLTCDRKNLKIKREARTRSYRDSLLKSTRQLFQNISLAVQEKEKSFFLLSGGFCLFYIIAFYLIAIPLFVYALKNYNYAVIFSGTLFFTLVLSYDFWVVRYRRWFSILWLTSLGYSLSFLSTYFLIQLGPNPMTIVNVFVSGSILLAVTDSRGAMLVGLLGILGALLIYPASLLNPHIASVVIMSAAYLVALTAFVTRSKEEAEQTKEKTLKSFTGILAHELRNPLAVIETSNRCFESLLEDKKIQDAETAQSIQDAIERSRMSCKRAHSFIDMALSQLKGDMLTEPKNIDVHTAIKEAIDNFGLHPKEKDLIRLALEKPSFSIYIDPQVFQHIIFNILKNALYAIRQKGNGSIELRTEVIGTIGHIYIKDEGIGIESSKQEKIFEKFYSQKTNSSGLGLSFCREMTRRFKGDIEIESTYGEYTECTLKFPTSPA